MPVPYNGSNPTGDTTMLPTTAEELIVAAIIEEKRRQKQAEKGKTTQDKPIVPESLQRAFNDL